MRPSLFQIPRQLGHPLLLANDKTADNVVVERDALGQRTVRFTPVSATATPSAIENLLGVYGEAAHRGVHHHLLLVTGFVLDFTVIHPFADGNGRISRLLTNFLLEQSGYDVGRYVSVERAIEATKDRYYDILLASTKGWPDGKHDVWPWTTYFVEILATTYAAFAMYAEEERAYGSKQDRVRNHLEQHAATEFTIDDLRRALPGISDATLRLVLRQLRKQGLVTTTTGRAATWRWEVELRVHAESNRVLWRACPPSFSYSTTTA